MQQTRSLNIPPQVEALLKAALQRVLREVGHLVILLLQHWLEKQLGQADGTGSDEGGGTGDTGQKSPTGEDDEEPHPTLPSPLPVESGEEPGRGEDEVTGSGSGGGASLLLPFPRAPQPESAPAAEQPRGAGSEEGSSLTVTGGPPAGPADGFGLGPSPGSREAQLSVAEGTADDMRRSPPGTEDAVSGPVNHGTPAAPMPQAGLPARAAAGAPLVAGDEGAQETAARGNAVEPTANVAGQSSRPAPTEAQPPPGRGAMLEGRKEGRSLLPLTSAERDSVPLSAAAPMPRPGVVRPGASGLAQGEAGFRSAGASLPDIEVLVARQVDSALRQRMADAEVVTVPMLEEFHRRQRREEMHQAPF